MTQNYNDNIGSSETTRESPFPTFDFTNYLCYHRPEHRCKEDTGITITFLEWFVGFTEGDGCFFSGMEEGRPRLRFTLTQKDAKLLYKVKKCLGFGYVAKDKDNFVFRVDDVRGIQRIQSIFNGNLVLPKIQAQFAGWVNFKPEIQEPTFRLIDTPLYPNALEPKVRARVLPSLEDAWISGFIEAEGCFYVKLDPNTDKPGFFTIKTHRLTITQKDTLGEKAILDHIKQLFKTKTKTYLVKSPSCFRIVMENKKSQKVVVKYLQRFCLLGKKRIAAFRWWRLYLMKQDKGHLLLVNQEKLQRLCKNLNKSQEECLDKNQDISE